MSDNTEDLVKAFEENVSREQHPRSIGLFTIPEYPELEVERGMWSSALDAILTTLRYLAPATLLTVFWGQQSFLFKILKHIDSAFRAIVFSSEEQKQAVLQWLAETGPVRVEHLDTVWRHGWVLCGALDAALPGACAGHPPTQLSLKHAQIIADLYLGVEPVFSRQELESNDSLSRHQEWKLATYLDRIRQALTKITPPVSKPISQRTSPETNKFILDYAAKGSGLTAVQINNGAYFNIYPTAQQCLDPGEVTILIRGPKDTYGMAVLPPILGKAQMIRHQLLGLQSKKTYTENVLPITQGATYLRSYGKNDMNKTYHIPKSQYDIEIDVDTRPDHVKISYMVKLEGKYLVSITSRGHNIVGSPFSVTASNNIINILEKDNFCLEDCEEIDIVDVQTDRKVVLRIVDFVTEKMLLNENGTLEKISDDEAKRLMMIDKGNEIQNFINESSDKIGSTTCKKIVKYQKFKKTAYKILIMEKICKVFKSLIINKNTNVEKEKMEIGIFTRNKQGIPDVVNSTLTEANVSPFSMPEKLEKIIVPESISVSLRAEISKSGYEDLIENTNDRENILIDISMESCRLNTPDSLETNISTTGEVENSIYVQRAPIITANNPFINEMFEENYVATNNFGTFVASEYETNNSQNEETRDSSITIIIDPNITPSPVDDASSSLVNSNPFIELNILELERPKTPVYKIISGEKLNRDEPIFIDPKAELIPEEELGNEFVNPFFMHKFESRHFDHGLTADFIIGAPVSLPPIIRTASPEPEMKSLIMTENENTFNNECSKKENTQASEFLTPLHNLGITIDNKKGKSATSPTFHSLDTSLTGTIDNSNASTTSDSQFEPDQSDSDRNSTPRRDMWDSAYVSIDDNNGSPDNNNNENTILCETFGKQKLPSCNGNIVLKKEEVINMGPAEREIWQTCNELKGDDASKSHEDVRLYKWELKRPMFTPIIEESDRSISSGNKEVSKSEITMKPRETDTVSVAFAELNDIYQEYFPNSETSSSPITDEDSKLHSMEVDYITQTKDRSVNSASEVSDVKRHSEQLEGTISEVQANATESDSVSQTLHNGHDYLEYEDENKVETQFGENRCSNIVLEKKKYWDERIKEIEAKLQATSIPKKKRNPLKQLKHDSLSKRKGKQMIKNFLSAGDYSQVKDVNHDTDRAPSYRVQELEDNQNNCPQSDIKIVKKWKSFWDKKLESDRIQNDAKTLTTKSPKKKLPSQITLTNQRENQTINTENIHESNKNSQEFPNNCHGSSKQELPEEIFKAFETSPKRFFGTSRKQIMNKIDTFLGKPTEANSSTADIAMCQESGLVSSRISLFHNISNTEELPWSKRKSQSLHNISQKRECEKNMAFMECTQNVKDTKDIAKNKYTEINIRKVQARNNATETIDLKTKRSKMMKNTNHTTLDETICEKPLQQTNNQTRKIYDKRIIEDKNSNVQSAVPKVDILRKKSFSKSEMDIFNKIAKDTIDTLDKYKSCDELPKINVKSFITLYESVSKTSEKTKQTKLMCRTKSADSQKALSNSIILNAVSTYNVATDHATTPRVTPTNLWTSKTSDTVSNLSIDIKPSDFYDIEILTNENKETTYLSLSDIELEIIESSPDKSSESTPTKKIEPEHIEYKNRFKLAKEYFQSLEELTDVRKPRKLNECELLLRKQSTESLDDEKVNERPQKRVKKNIKSNSLPSSEIAQGWNQLKENQERSASEERSNTKLVKISEKFNVDDLFIDVTEGKLSRQGSLRGIPHKKAVLEAFRSMENIADTSIKTLEISDSHFTDFASEHTVKNAQTYLKEYPYLPTTDPSKYHSRVDIKASGLISFKELMEKKPRRNSVPDLRLNPSFTAHL